MPIGTIAELICYNSLIPRLNCLFGDPLLALAAISESGMLLLAFIAFWC